MNSKARDLLLEKISNDLASGLISLETAKIRRKNVWAGKSFDGKQVNDWPDVARGEGVYVVGEVGSDYIKIGSTIDFRKRWGSVCRVTDNPRRLFFVGWLSRNPEDEKRFQEKFKRCDLGGGTEWFIRPPDLEAFLVQV